MNCAHERNAFWNAVTTSCEDDGYLPWTDRSKKPTFGFNGFTKDTQIVQTFEIDAKKFMTKETKGRPEVYLYFHSVCQIDQQILTPLTVFDVMNGLHDNTAYLICAQSEPALAASSSYLKINIDTDSLRNRQKSSLNPNSKMYYCFQEWNVLCC